MYSLQEVFKAANCPVDFETFFFSEVNPTMSARLEDVTASIKKNKVCLKVRTLVVMYRKSHMTKSNVNMNSVNRVLAKLCDHSSGNSSNARFQPHG